MKYDNAEEFLYKINIDSDIVSTYDEKIKSVTTKLDRIKKVLKSNKGFEESEVADNSNILISDKSVFKDNMVKCRRYIRNYGKMLRFLKMKKDNLSKLIKSVNYYNENLDSINRIINQYNIDIVHGKKKIDDLSMLSEYQNKISMIVNFNYSDVDIKIDINKLKQEYAILSNIIKYYENNLKEKDDEKKDKINDGYFVFLSPNDEKYNRIIDYNTNINSNSDDNSFIFLKNDDNSKKKRIHKITKIRKASKCSKIKKALKKNLSKVLAGLMLGITMLGISTFSAGYEKNNGYSSDKGVVSTIDSVSVDDIIDKIEEAINDDNNIIYEENQNSQSAKDSVNDISIGSRVSVDSNIYSNANNAYKRENVLKSSYSNDDEREVSLIYYSNNEGDTEVISKDNKDRIDELKNLKYEVVAYCTNNITHDVDYEGWYNVDDVKVLVK